MAFAVLTYPSGTLDFLGTGTETPGTGLVLTELAGIYQPPIRAPIDNQPQTDGGIVHQFFYGPRHLTVEGFVLPFGKDDSNKATLWATMDSLIAALNAILRADGTFTWTPPGQTAHSLTVRCDEPATFTGSYRKTFVFGLVAADPDITVA